MVCLRKSKIKYNNIIDQMELGVSSNTIKVYNPRLSEMSLVKFNYLWFINQKLHLND